MRKIIHIDMDCFYAAIEARDNPALKGRALAVGGTGKRGVLTTASYEARKFGVRSAIPTAMALKLCPHLILLPPDMKKYAEESRKIREIFHRFTDVVEPLSLDEAYLDITGSRLHKGSATLIAREIRETIKKETGLTASAGIAPNKFLAKVASDWKKPDGQFAVTPEMVEEFVKTLPIGKVWGVGKVTAEKMSKLGVRTCGDLQRFSREELSGRFGRFGSSLYLLCRGIDDRPVVTSRIRKSLSAEETFGEDLKNIDECRKGLKVVYERFRRRLENKYRDAEVKTLFVKVKFNDFTTTTVERSFPDLDFARFSELLEEGFNREGKPVRLLGAGVRFRVEEDEGEKEEDNPYGQLSLFSLKEDLG